MLQHEEHFPTSDKWQAAALRALKVNRIEVRHQTWTWFLAAFGAGGNNLVRQRTWRTSDIRRSPLISCCLDTCHLGMRCRPQQRTPLFTLKSPQTQHQQMSPETKGVTETYREPADAKNKGRYEKRSGGDRWEDGTGLSWKSHFKSFSVQKQTSIMEVLGILIKGLFNMVIASGRSKRPND